MTPRTYTPPSITVGGRSIPLTLSGDFPRGTRPARYGWIIDRDELHLRAPELFSSNSAGYTGPHNISTEVHQMLATLSSGGSPGREFRIYDADGEVLYTGRLITSDAAIGTSRDYAPLDDYGRASGGTDIAFWHEDAQRWIQL